MKTENTLVVVIILIAMIAVLSLFFAFRSINKTGGVIYTEIPGYKQKGLTVHEWTEYLESSPEIKGRRARESEPRFWYAHPGDYEEGLKGNYEKGRFGGIVPKNVEYRDNPFLEE